MQKDFDAKESQKWNPSKRKKKPLQIHHSILPEKYTLSFSAEGYVFDFIGYRWVPIVNMINQITRLSRT
jgi:hypothetical protein